MTMMIKTLALGAGFAALAAAAPAAAQYYPYGNAYGYNSNVTNVAAQRCAAAVQQRLSMRGSSGIIGQLFGINNYNHGRVLSITRVNPNRNTVRVRGLASSGRMAAYSPYGVGAYGMLGSNYAHAADLSFRCDVDYRGFVRDVDINRR
ncbi:MAG TPA: hypothetical protein VGD23_01800 [Sphingomicrobium sp.]